MLHPKLRKVSRGVWSDVVETAGLGCLVGAAWWWMPLVGLLSLGAALVLIGWAVDDR